MEQRNDFDLEEKSSSSSYKEDQRQIDPSAASAPTKAIGNQFRREKTKSVNAELNHRVASLRKIAKRKAKDRVAKSSRRKNRK